MSTKSSGPPLPAVPWTANTDTAVGPAQTTLHPQYHPQFRPKTGPPLAHVVNGPTLRVGHNAATLAPGASAVLQSQISPFPQQTMWPTQQNTHDHQYHPWLPSQFGGSGGIGLGGGGGLGYGYGIGNSSVNSPFYGAGYLHNGLPQPQPNTSPTFTLVSTLVHSFASFAALLENTFHTSAHSLAALTAVGHQISSLCSPFARLLGRPKITSANLQQPKPCDSAVSLFGHEMIPIPTHGHGATTATVGAVAVAATNRHRSTTILWLLAALVAPLAAAKVVSIILQHLQQRQVLQNTNSPVESSLPRKESVYRALYDLGPDPARGILPFSQGDKITLLQTSGMPNNLSPTWWLGRSATGAVGLFPSNYVVLIENDSEMPQNNTSSTVGGSNSQM